ncbi:MAG: Ig-like domain-containing protein [Eubacteriales bacterium]|nr:Ig-like domain-containing protein [Eubacteriales bacterium]
MAETRKKLCWMPRFAVLLVALLLAFGAGNVRAAGTVKLNKKSISIFKGKTYTLRMQGTTEKVTWSSNKKSIATVNKNGKVTAKKKGKAVITAKVGSKKYTCSVTVKQPVTSVTLSKKTLTMNQGNSVAISAVTKPTTANNRKVKWSSSNKKVATVTAKGLIKAVGKGTATITAKAADGSGKKATCKVTVTAKSIKVTSLTLNKKKMSVQEGKTGALISYLSPSTATNKKVVWSSSNRSVATVNYLGRVTALKAGKTTITVKAMDGSGKKASCAVTVTAKKTSSTVTTTTSSTPSAGAKRLLSAMEKISKQVQADYKAGKPWKYAGGNYANLSQAASGKTTCCNEFIALGLRVAGFLPSDSTYKKYMLWNYGPNTTLRKDKNSITGSKAGFQFKDSGTRTDNIWKALQGTFTIEPSSGLLNKSADQLIAEGKIIPGDIVGLFCGSSKIGHIAVYAGNGMWYDGGHAGSNGYYKGSTYYFTTTGPISRKGYGDIVGQIIRIVK